MSSTGRGTIREVNDHYDTPEYTIQSLLNAHDVKYQVLEPCAGNLAIVNMLKHEKVYSMDINPESPAQLHCDYLTREHVPACQTIITNPPNLAPHLLKIISMTSSSLIGRDPGP